MSRARVAVVAAAAFGLLTCGAQARLAQLDPTFGHRGVLTTSFESFPARVLTLPNGSTLVALTLGSPEHFAVVRLKPNGSLDRSFGSLGIASAHIDASSNVQDMALEPDGEIIVVGTALPNPCCVKTYVALARFRPNGKLDRSFGQNGVVEQKSPTIGREGTSVVVQPDRKFVVGGWDNGFMVARYDANGKHLDPTFDGDGVAGVPGDAGKCGASSESGTARLLLGAGYIIASGICGGKGSSQVFTGVLRYRAGTTLDGGAFSNSFGSGGVATTPFSAPNEPRGIVRRRDGRLVQAVGVGSGSSSSIGLVGFTANGGYDSAFGVGGVETLGSGSPADLALGPGGKLLLAASDSSDRGTFALVRRTPSGSADTSFAPGGRAAVHVGSKGSGIFSISGAFRIAVAGDGRVLEAGLAHIGGKLVVVLVRFGALPRVANLHLRGHVLSYSDTEPATTTITLVHGRHAITFTHRDRGGSNSLTLRGHGRYLLSVDPAADGLTGVPVRLRVTL